MSEKQDGKLQTLIEKFGGWAAIALVTLASFMYQSDKTATQLQIATLEKSVAASNRAIERVRVGYVSKEEFKNVQESWIRETAGLRQDIRDYIKMQQQK